jgi:hypothetical protein
MKIHLQIFAWIILFITLFKISRKRFSFIVKVEIIPPLLECKANFLRGGYSEHDFLGASKISREGLFRREYYFDLYGNIH